MVLRPAAETFKKIVISSGDEAVVLMMGRTKLYKSDEQLRQLRAKGFWPQVVKAQVKVEAPAPKAKKAAPKAEAPVQDFSKMTVAQLKELAKAKGITGISAMKKADLISALS